MRYLKDFNSMMAKEFLGEEVLKLIHGTNYESGLHHWQEVDRLNSDLDRLNPNEIEIAERVLKIMTKLSCIKEMYKMKVTLNVLKNQNGVNKYVQARGAISTEKGKRIQVAHYVDLIGFKTDMSSIEDLKQLIKDPHFKQMAREAVIKKIEPELKSINGL